MRIYLKKDIASDTTKIMEMKTNMQATYLKDILATKGTTVFKDTGPIDADRTGYMCDMFKEDGVWVKLFYAIQCNQVFLDVDTNKISKHVIRLVFDQKILDRRGITVNAIAIHLKGLFDGEMLIAYSDINAGKCVIRLRLIYPKAITKDDEDTEEKFMKQFLRQHLKELQLCGANTITKVFVDVEDKFNQKSNEKRKFFLETEGSDLKMVLNWHGVDTERTYCNNPTEIIKVLGVEAARQSIILEIRKVMNFYGIQVNYRHLGLLADTMTYRGKIMAINRHGLNHTKVGPLKKCTFEETVDMLLDAGKESMFDDLSSVSASIIVGKLGNFGTGSFDLKFDKKQFDRERVSRKRGNQRNESSFKPQRYYEPSQSKPIGRRRKKTPTITNVKESRPFSEVYSPIRPPQYDTSNTNNYQPSQYDPSQQAYAIDPVSPMSPTSPMYSPMSPLYSPSKTEYDPENPGYNLENPGYDPENPGYNSGDEPDYTGVLEYDPTNPCYSPVRISENDYNPYTNIPSEKKKKEESEQNVQNLFGWL